VQDNPEILRCKPETVMKALRTLAGAGLVPDGREAAIVPFKGAAQAMPMVFGLIKVARNSGQIKSLWSDVVYEGEAINVWIEDGERKWDHVQTNGEKIDAMNRGGKILGAYAVAKLSDGTVDFQPMSRAEIEKRRKASANQKSDQPTGIWEKWYDEMAKKPVIRNLSKRLPMSTEDVSRMSADHDTADMRDVTPDQAERPKQSLASKIQGSSPEPVQEGEILDAEHWTDGIDTSEAFPGDDAFDEGVKAFNAETPRISCPYQSNDPASVQWLGGWDQAQGAKG